VISGQNLSVDFTLQATPDDLQLSSSPVWFGYSSTSEVRLRIFHRPTLTLAWPSVSPIQLPGLGFPVQR